MEYFVADLFTVTDGKKKHSVALQAPYLIRFAAATMGVNFGTCNP
jgi:hypothetical protein